MASLILGETIHETIGGSGDRDHFEFSVPSATRVYVDALSSYDSVNWNLKDASDTVLGSASALSESPVIDLPAGRYSLDFDISGDSLGGYSFRLLDVGAVSSSITVGSNVSGTLNPATSSAFYKFTANAGDHFYLDSTTVTPLNASWRLLDPYGRTVFETGLGGDMANITLSATGSYTICVEGAISDPGTLDYQFVVSFLRNDPPVSFSGTPLILGTAVSGNISTPDEVDRFTFNLPVSSRLNFDALLMNGNDFYWSLEGPTGTVVSNRFLPYDTYYSFGTQPSLNLVPGDYQLSIGSLSQSSIGDYSFRLFDLSSAELITPGTLVHGSLSPSNETNAYRFIASAGDKFYFDGNGTFNAGWNLLDPQGRVVAVAAGNSDIDTQTLAFTGTYTMLWEGYFFNSEANIDYSFTVWPILNAAPTPLVLGNTVSSNIGVAGESDQYTFALDGNRRLAFDSLNTAGNLTWTLTGPAGDIVSSQPLEYDSLAYFGGSPLFSLTSGTYTLTIDGNADSTGAYSFRMLNLDSATPIVFGDLTSGKLDPANETKAYQFNASGGERFFFDFQTVTPLNSQWVLVDPQDNLIGSASLASDGEFKLPSIPGQYLLLLVGYPFDSGTVDYAFNVSKVTIAAPLPMTIGSVVSGALSSPGEFDQFSFTLNSVSQLYFDALQSPGNFNWTLKGPAGNIVSGRNLTADSFYHNGNDLSLSSLIPGEYQLTVDGDGAATGAYSFRMFDLALATPAPLGGVVNGSLSPANETDLFKFDASAGDSFYFDSQTTSPSNAGWSLLDPLGRTVVSASLGADIDLQKLTLAGTYTLLVEGYFGDVGSVDYAFKVVPVTIAAPISITVGSTVSGNISAPGEFDRYQFSLASNRRLYFDTLQSTVGLLGSLQGPAGMIVNGIGLENDTNSGFNPGLDLVPGDYILTIDGSGSSVGDYSFRLIDLNAATPLVLSSLTSGNLSPASETRAYQFDVNAGDKFFFSSTTVTPMNASWRILDPVGVTLAASGLGSDLGVQSFSLTGKYTLLIEGYYSDLGSLSYSFVASFLSNTPPAAFTGTPIVLGDVVSSSISVAHEFDEYTFSLPTKTNLVFDTLQTDGNINWTLKGPTGLLISQTPLEYDYFINLLSNLLPGNYQITIDAVGTATGAYSFRLFDLASATSIVPDSIVNGSLSTADESDAYQFTATAGQRFYFDSQTSNAQSARWQLVDPLGQVTTTAGLGADIDVQSLTMSGQYTLILIGYYSDTGSIDYSFNVVSVPQSVPVPITLGATIDSSIGSAGESDIYTFTLGTPSRLYFDAMQTLGSLTWSLSGPAGEIVAGRRFDTDSYFNFGSPLPKNLLPGSYQLTIDGQGDQTGSYAFRLLDLTNAPSIATDTIINGTLSPANETDAYQFTATAGAQFYFDSQTANAQNSSWLVIDPLGRAIISRSLGSSLDVQTLPLTGQYTLLFEGYFYDTADINYSFRVLSVAAPVAVPLTLGTVVNSVISAVGESDIYTFDLSVPSRLYFDALQTPGNLTWSLKGPTGDIVSGRSLESDSLYNFGYVSSLNNLIPGSYQLTIDGNSDHTGNYSFRLFDIATAPSFTPGTPISGSLSPVNETDVYQFTAVAGSNYYFDSQTANAQNAGWSLMDPLGRIVSVSNLGGDIDVQTLHLSGQYTLFLEGYFFDTDSILYTFKVQSVDFEPANTVLLTGFVDENEPVGTPSGLLSTSDVDGSSIQSYSLVAGIGDNDNSKFSIADHQLKTNAIFDFESKSSYSIRVRTVDNIGLSFERVYTVLVHDVNETPTNILLSNNSIPENASANANIGTLTSVDPDAGGSFTYTLVAGTGDNDNAAFNLNGGVLRATSSFDFESKSSYSVRLRTTDQGGLFFEKAFTILVTNVNETPTDILLSSNSILENEVANTTVGTLTSSDPDAGGSFTYTLVAGTGSNDNAAFNISGGALRATSGFDFEAKNNYSIRLRTTDQDGLFFEKAFTILVTNVNETPTGILLSSTSIAENAIANAPVGTLTTEDPDSGGSFTYTLVDGSGSTDNSAFNISGGTLQATSSFDFEFKNNYSIRLRTTDQGGLFFEKAFSILVTNVNETPTNILLSSNSILENAGSNATIGTLTSSDPDAGGSFTYTLAAGTGSTDNAAFNISGGELRANSSFDFESKKNYSIRLRTTDQGGLFFEKTFEILVTNVNETPTDILLSNNSIPENSVANSSIGTLTSSDPDDGSSFTYTLVAGTGSTDNAAFNLSGETLRATSSFDFESKKSYAIRLRTTDQDGLFFEKAFTIQVTDIDEKVVLGVDNATVTGEVGSTLSNTGTWVDPEGGSVSLTTSIGTIIKNNNGTWTWNNTPTSVQTNQLVTVTANDGVNTSNITFVMNVIAATPVLTITSGDKVYDRGPFVATSTLTGSVSPTPTISYVFYSDALGQNAIAAPIKVGTYYVQGNSSANANNNAAQTPIVSFKITPAPLVASVVINNKPFDGTTTATIVSRSLSGILGTDIVNVTGGVANFADAGVGNSKTVTVNGLTISGADASNYVANASATALADITATVFNRQVYYKGSSFAGGGVDAALDTAKSIVRSGSAPQTLGFANLINSSRGINGLVFDVAGFVGSTASRSDFGFYMSPTGNFNEASNPPSSWASAPSPTLIAVTAGNATTPARIRIEWPDNAIENRWLQIRILANANTGLPNQETFYVGHLQGETDGLVNSRGLFQVSNSDIAPVKPLIGTNATADSIVDLDKDAKVRNEDISYIKSGIGIRQLRVITIPIQGSAGEGSGGNSPGRAVLPLLSVPLTIQGSIEQRITEPDATTNNNSSASPQQGLISANSSSEMATSANNGLGSALNKKSLHEDQSIQWVDDYFSGAKLDELLADSLLR